MVSRIPSWWIKRSHYFACDDEVVGTETTVISVPRYFGCASNKLVALKDDQYKNKSSLRLWVPTNERTGGTAHRSYAIIEYLPILHGLNRAASIQAKYDGNAIYSNKWEQ